MSLDSTIEGCGEYMNSKFNIYNVDDDFIDENDNDEFDDDDADCYCE